VSATPGEVFSLMHPSNLPDRATFVTNEDYARLQDEVRSLATGPASDAWTAAAAAAVRDGAVHVQNRWVAGLQVAGVIDPASGRAELLSVVPAAGPPAPDATGDGLGLEARSASGALLGRVAIAPTAPDRWHAPETPAALRPFAAFVPAGVDVGSLRVLDDDRLLSERRASENPPVLDAPEGPLDATAGVALAWRASDPDGDPLRFDVDYAPDGRDWRPLALGLREPALRISPDALPAGPEPTIRIVARDGMRAAAAEVALLVDGAPRLVATVPAEGETVPPTTEVTVWTLGELGRLGPEALTVLRDDAPADEPARTPGRLERLPAGHGVRFVPDAPLAAEASYRAVFGTGVTAADGTPHGDVLAWTFRTGTALPERAIQQRNLSGRPLGSSADEEADATSATAAELPETCAGLQRAAYTPLLPAGVTVVEAGETDGACRLVVTSSGAPDEVRAFVERAILTNALFLTANRSDGDVVRIGARGSAFDAEAVIEPGPPTRLTWLLGPAER